MTLLECALNQKGSFMLARQKGVTLVELILSMIIMTIAVVVVSVMVANQSSQSYDPMLKVRATELAQSLLNEITARSFDHNSDHVGGNQRCDDRIPGETAGPACTEPLSVCDGTPFPDAEEGAANRSLFNDVDDYNCLDQSGDEIANSVGLPLSGLYNNYRVQVFVSYDGNYDGTPDDSSQIANRGAKLIEVVVTEPTTESIQFAAYKANY